MSSGILILFAAIVATTDHDSFMHDHTTNRHFSFAGCLRGQLKGKVHKWGVDGFDHLTAHQRSVWEAHPKAPGY